jgi:alpha/beta superfamily hydrolase
MKKLLLALVLWTSALSTPVFAKTFVGVLWPMFGPLPAIGLVELVAELKMLPDVEVNTYLHQNWPQLVDDLQRQPPGTRTVVVGYSLGANSTVFVANKTNYIDVIIALQPSMLSWNPEVTGRVGRMLEVYNPNPSETFGGMGSKKLIGPNIEYIANNDSHPGAQFSTEFRNLVKSEIARVSAEPAVVTAQAPAPATPALAFADARAPAPAVTGTVHAPTAPTPVTVQVAPRVMTAEVPLPMPKPVSKPTRPAAVTKLAAAEPASPSPRQEPSRQEDAIALLDAFTSAVDSGNLFAQRPLTTADMMDYAKRNYRNSRTAELLATDSEDR